MNSFDPDPAFDAAFDQLAGEMQRKTYPKQGPRYGVRALAEVANELNRATEALRADSMEAEQAVRKAIRLLYDQSNWIGKVWDGLVLAAQEAER